MPTATTTPAVTVEDFTHDAWWTHSDLWTDPNAPEDWIRTLRVSVPTPEGDCLLQVHTSSYDDDAHVEPLDDDLTVRDLTALSDPLPAFIETLKTLPTTREQPTQADGHPDAIEAVERASRPLPVAPSPQGVTLSRHAHDYANSSLHSTALVCAYMDDGGGAVELLARLWVSSVSRNGHREPVPSSNLLPVKLAFTPEEARVIGQQLLDMAEAAGYANAPQLVGEGIPAGTVVLESGRSVEGSTCTTVCQHGHAKTTVS